MCVDCAEDNLRRSSEFWAMCRAHGLCGQCGGAAALPERTMCSDCLVKHAAAVKKRLKRRKARGLCVRCPNPARPARLTCAPCGARAVVHAKKE